MSRNMVMGLSFVFLGCVASGQTCDKWGFANPVPQGNTIHDLDVIGSEVWAVGEFGLVMTSTDGENWTVHPRFTDLHLFGISYGMGLWMIVAEDGWVFTSSNGTEWMPAHVDTEDIHAVAFGTDDAGTEAFVVVGANATIRHSFNGLDWYSDIVTGYAGDLLDVIFDTDRFVAVGEEGAVGESSNLSDWLLVTVSIGTTSWLGVSRIGIWLYICGENGTILRTVQSLIGPWTDVSAPTPETVHKVVFFGDQHYTIGERIYSSNTGDVWTLNSFMREPLLDGVVLDDILVAAGIGGNHVIRDDVLFYQHPGFGLGVLRGICHGPNGYLTVGDGGILGSADGTVWDKLNVTNLDLQDVTYFDGAYVAVQKDGRIKSSVDGSVWVEDYSDQGENLYGIASSALDAVAVGADGKLVKKDFGGAWTPLYLLGIDDLYDICHAWLSIYHGKFVAVGENGKIVTSPDGATWTVPTGTGTTHDLHSVCYYGGIYMAAGEGVIVWSNDADVWTPAHFLSQFSFDHVFWNGETFCVFGTFDHETVVYGTYDDAQGDWVLSFPRLSSPVFDTVRDDGQLIGVGANSSIVIPGHVDLDLENWPQPDDVLDFTDQVNVFCQ